MAGKDGHCPAGAGGGNKQDDDTTKRRLEVEYADGETCCFGYWNPKEFRFHTSDDVTHVFTLHPCTAWFPQGGKAGPIMADAEAITN